MSLPFPPPGWQNPQQPAPPPRRMDYRTKRALWVIAGFVGLLIAGGAINGAVNDRTSAPTVQTGTALPFVAPTTSGTPVTPTAAPAATTVTPTPRPTTAKPSPSTLRPTPTRSKTTAPKPRATTKKPKPRATTPKPKPEEDVFYANCTEVRDAGADPIHRGDPGYSRKLDRDGDGVGCE